MDTKICPQCYTPREVSPCKSCGSLLQHTSARKIGLHYSRVSSFLKCKQAHRYAYENLLSPRVTASVMEIGTYGHACLETIIRGQSVGEAKSKAISEISNTAPPDKREISVSNINRGFEAAEWVARETRLVEDWDTVVFPDGKPGVEIWLKSDIQSNYFPFFHGTLDWVATHRPSGLTLLVDFKFRGQFLPEWCQELDLQRTLYLKLASDAGVHIHGTADFQIHNKPPSTPKLNKDGSMSRSSIRTTWGIYSDNLIRAGLNPDDYVDMMEKLKDVCFHRYTQNFKTPYEVQRVWEEMERVADLIGLSQKSDIVPRTMNFMSCNMCRYRELCIEDLKGQDTSFLVSQSFLVDNEEPVSVDPGEYFELED